MKKALFFSYFWPPSGKASLLQPLKVVTYLPEFGIEPVVVTVKEESFTEKDDSLLSLIPPSLRVMRTDAWEPFDLYRKLIGKSKDEKLVASETISVANKSLGHRLSVWIRMNCFIPDARIGWFPYAVKACSALLEKEKFDFIITNGPPHSTHLIGKKLSQRFGIPHIPIFIDPWIDIAYYQGLKRSQLAKAIDRHFERSVVNNAALNVFVTPSTRDDFIQKYPAIKDKTDVMYWGYDADAFNGITAVPKEARETKTIIHAGNIFDFQDPKTLWPVIAARINSGEKFRIKFIGTVGPLVRQSIAEAGLSGITEFAGYLPYHDMLAELLNADYLLVCASERRHIPGKLFEYMHTGTPILAFADDNPDMAELLSLTGAGKLYSYHDIPNDFFAAAGNLLFNKSAALGFDRKCLTEKFAARLLELNNC